MDANTYYPHPFVSKNLQINEFLLTPIILTIILPQIMTTKHSKMLGRDKHGNVLLYTMEHADMQLRDVVHLVHQVKTMCSGRFKVLVDFEKGTLT